MLALLVALIGLTHPAQAQSQAKGTLYTRAKGEDVFAVAVIRIDEGWYLYHTDLGHPDAIGLPTTFSFNGDGVEWSEVVMKDPKVKKSLFDDSTYAYHEGRTYAYAKGRRTESGELGPVSLEIFGQTCNPSTCVDYEETLRSSGEGSERYWSDWPASLGAGPLASSQDESPESSTSTGEPVVGATALGPPVSIGLGGAFSEDPVTGKVYVDSDEDSGEVLAAVVLDVAPGSYIYHGPTEDDLGHEESASLPTVIRLSGGGVEWSKDVTYPEPVRHDDGYPASDGTPVWSWTHEGEVTFWVEGVDIDGWDPEYDFEATVEGQVCDATGCRDLDLTLEHAGDIPEALLLASTTIGSSEVEAGGESADSSVADVPADSSGEAPPKQGLFAYLLLAVIWGFVTLLMPCTYPMIPITISFFTKQAESRGGRVLPLSIAYGLGIVLMFIVLGALLGGPVQYFANHWVTQIVIGALFLFFALVLWGVVDLQPPAIFLRMASQASQKGGMVGVFLMGLTLVVTSFSCTAPFVGDVIARGAKDGWLRPIVGMGVFGLTMAVPFVLLSLFPARLQKMPSAGEWMHALKVSLGFIEFAAAFKFFSGADLVKNTGLIPDELFLVIWAGSFLGLAMFLFGWIRLKGETNDSISPGRMASGLVSLIFSLYLGIYGMLGYPMDPLMTSILPGYSVRPEAVAGPGVVARPEVIKDDLDAAVAAATSKDKLLLLNFTGFN